MDLVLAGFSAVVLVGGVLLAVYVVIRVIKKILA